MWLGAGVNDTSLGTMSRVQLDSKGKVLFNLGEVLEEVAERTMKYLQYEDFLDAAKNCREGEKIRVNHDVPDCYGTSKSMIIERKTNGDVTAYCFRCGKSGRYRTFTLKSKSSGEER